MVLEKNFSLRLDFLFPIAMPKHYEQENSQKEAFNLGSQF